MRRTWPFLCIVFLWMTGCHTVEEESLPTPKSETTRSVTKSKDSKGRLDREKGLKAEVIAAVSHALGLERQLFHHSSSFKSEEQVYRHYRQGFGPKLARRLTEYSWAGGEIGLRPGDPTMESPKTIEVSQIHGQEAIAFYDTPEWQRAIWGTKKFTVVKLKKEKGRWVIVEAKGVDTAPSH